MLWGAKACFPQQMWGEEAYIILQPLKKGSIKVT